MVCWREPGSGIESQPPFRSIWTMAPRGLFGSSPVEPGGLGMPSRCMFARVVATQVPVRPLFNWEVASLRKMGLLGSTVPAVVAGAGALTGGLTGGGRREGGLELEGGGLGGVWFVGVWLAGAWPSDWNVFGPAMPSTSSPLASWKRLTAASVF